MNTQQYENAVELIKKAGGGDFEGPKPESLVVKAESALGLTFPPSYRRFLLEFGCEDINGLEIFGLINDNFDKSTIPNGIWLTLNERQAISLAQIYVIIGDSGDGSYYALDTGQTDAIGENPVVRLSLDGAYIGTIADNFSSFLVNALIPIV